MVEQITTNLDTGLPEYLQNLNFKKTFDSLNTISQLPRETVIEMSAEQRNVIAEDLVKEGIVALERSGIGHPSQQDLSSLGLKWGILKAIYSDFQDRSTKITRPVPISRNEEMAIDLMGGMGEQYPEIAIVSKVVAGTLAERTFPGTKRA